MPIKPRRVTASQQPGEGYTTPNEPEPQPQRPRLHPADLATPLGVVRLKRGREKPVRQGHPWIFSGAIEALPAADATGAPDGAIVDVMADSGEWLARGYLNRRSQIQVRILTWEREEAVDKGFWQRRIRQALTSRAPFRDESSALRLINGESDYLPGLIVDQVGEWLVLQAGTLGIDLRKQILAAMLMEATGARGLIERSELALRRQEGLAEAMGQLAGEAPPARIEVHEFGKRFLVDIAHGQKTGFYSDQRFNRQRVAAWSAGRRVLNAFSYTGAFAVHALAAGATHVTNVDSSVEALEMAEENLALNGFDVEAQAELIAGDVFQVLRDWSSEPGGPRFDLIVLDPPKFAHSQAQLDRALRGYKDINLHALRLLNPGGILATFSCSGLVSADLFQKVVFGAAVDALGPTRPVQILEWLRQAADHPVAITFPEGEYLKGLICLAA
ncbi:MAG: class I SAM-dependent rRNA methyltransferase [Caldilineaceae bacterium]